jgi:unsaturated chondroitin disaccharide hydrolase
LDNVPADGVAFWDFDDPEIPAAPRDTAATAIAISGLLKLSASMAEGARSARYSQYARTVVTELSLKYLTPTTQHDRRSAGILTGGCFSMKPQLRSIDITPTHDCELIFGSYFFMESLMVLTGRHQASTF